MGYLLLYFFGFAITGHLLRVGKFSGPEQFAGALIWPATAIYFTYGYFKGLIGTLTGRGDSRE